MVWYNVDASEAVLDVFYGVSAYYAHVRGLALEDDQACGVTP